MTFSLILTITHPSWEKPVEHVDMLQGASRGAVLKGLSLSNKKMCDLRSHNRTYWKDTRGAIHTLELRQEAN